jgi:anti-sigma factor ChrR (cupin superfamily)
MAHNQITDELLDRLTLYSLDLLDAPDSENVSRHLDEGCPVCRKEVAEIRETFARSLIAGLELRQPPVGLRRRVLEAAHSAPAATQVWKKWEHSPNSALHVVRRGEGDWELVAPGVRARQLYVDRERESITMMVRMEPGSSYAPHRHAGPEQCYVLEGDLFDGAGIFQAGDFQCAAEGSIHGIQSTRNGCLLLIVSSLHDQLLA